MQNDFNIWGTFKSKELESHFQNSIFLKNKSYTFLTYFFCCFFFVLAGVFGDFQRTFFHYSAMDLLYIRIGLLGLFVVFFLVNRKAKERPGGWDLWLDAMKIISSIAIFLLTWWTEGESLTLLPGIMMMVACFYVVLPGSIWSTNLCAIFLFVTFVFWQNPAVTYGVKVHRYMIFMLFAIDVLLFFFKSRIDRWARVEFLSKNELDTINNTKDKILATIAHDIRNPLAIIMSKAERCSMEVARDNYDNVEATQKGIVKSVTKLDGLLVDILDWAVVEMQKGKTLKEKTCITETIKDAIEFLSEQANSKDIELFILLEPKEMSHERKMMSTCVRNVLSNAIKFSNWGDQVSIVGRQIENSYEITIGDKGPGIEEDVVKDILSGQNFKTELGSEGEKGTGLGLKLVQNVINRHLGKMSIETKIGEGTNFIFVIPIQD
jgi:signal transduction histidine kinase